VAQYEKEFMAAKVPAAQVGLLFSTDANLLNGIIQNDNFFCYQAISGYYEAFHKASIPVDILHCDRISAEELQKYKFIVAPGILTLDQKQGVLLAGYVRNGGNLLLDPLTGSWDEHGTLADTLPGAGLADLAGVSGEELHEEQNGVLQLVFNGKRYCLPRKYTFARWQSSPETEIPVQDADGNGFIWRKCAGKGTVWLSGMALGNLNSSGQTIGDDFRSEAGENLAGNTASLIEDIASACGVAPEFQADVPFHVSALTLPDGGEFLLIINLSNETATGKIRCISRKNMEYKGIYGSADIRFSADGGAAFTLPACSCCVLRKVD
jgi:hypothetical protein